MKTRHFVIQLMTYLWISSAVHAQERATVSTVAGTVALVRPASPMLVADMSFGQRILNALGHPEEPLTTTSLLQNGDGLRSEDAEAAVLLECASGATQTLSGAFDAILRIGADGKACKLEVRAGLVSATTAADPNAMPGGNPELQVGDVTLGASSTLFGVSVEMGQAEAFVIDGAITVRRPGDVLPVNAGQMMAIHTRALQTIPDARFEKVANVYAKLDVVNLPMADRLAKQQQLQTAYVVAFKRPQDMQARAQLNQSLSTVTTAPNPARAYQIRKQAVLTPQNLQHYTPTP